MWCASCLSAPPLCPTSLRVVREDFPDVRSVFSFVFVRDTRILLVNVADRHRFVSVLANSIGLYDNASFFLSSIQVGHCNECGAEIGGEGHVPVSSVKRVYEISESLHSQPGYVLLGGVIDEVLATCRTLDALSLRTLRFFLHSLLYLANANHVSVTGLLKNLEGRSISDISKFLSNHVMNDFTQLLQLTSLNSEDGELMLHLIIRRFHSTCTRSVSDSFNGMTAENRQAFEQYWMRNCVQPVSQDLRNQVAHLRELGSQKVRFVISPCLYAHCFFVIFVLLASFAISLE